MNHFIHSQPGLKRTQRICSRLYFPHITGSKYDNKMTRGEEEKTNKLDAKPKRDKSKNKT